jgi:hypothetical protein
MRETSLAHAVVGTTPAEIHANFAPTFAAHLHTLHVTGGDAAVYKFLWSMSAFQYCQVAVLYDLSAPGHSGIPPSFLDFFEYPWAPSYVTSPHAGLNRLISVNVLFNSTGTTVPGGRRAVQKIGTIAGFPAGTTLTEVWAEYASIEGVTAGQSVVLMIADLRDRSRCTLAVATPSGQP